MIYFEAKNRTAKEQEIEDKKSNEIKDRVKELQLEYLKALTKIKDNDIIEARNILDDLVQQFEDDRLTNKLKRFLDSKGIDENDAFYKETKLLLKYIYQNLGLIYEKEEEELFGTKENQVNYKGMPFYPKSLFYFSKATDVEGDIMLFFKMGVLSKKYKMLNDSKHYFGKSLKIDNSNIENFYETLQNPFEWLCLTNLIEVLYEMKDFYSCKKWLDVSLKVHPNYARGKELLSIIDSGVGIGDRITPEIYENSTKKVEPIRIEIQLKDLDWISFGDLLIETYSRAAEREEYGEINIMILEDHPTPKEDPYIDTSRKQSTGSVFIDLTSNEDENIVEVNTPVTRHASKRVQEMHSKFDKKFKEDSFPIDVYNRLSKIFSNINLSSGDNKYKNCALFELFQSTDGPLEIMANLIKHFPNQDKELNVNFDHIAYWESKFSSIWNLGMDQALDKDEVKLDYDIKKENDVLLSLIGRCNDQAMSIYDWALEYIFALIGNSSSINPLWLTYKWPIDLKVIVCDMILFLTQTIYSFQSKSFLSKTFTEICLSICELLLDVKSNSDINDEAFKLSNNTSLSDALNFWFPILEVQINLCTDNTFSSLVRYWWLKSWFFSYEGQPLEELNAIDKAVELISKNMSSNDKDSELPNFMNLLNSFDHHVNVNRLNKRAAELRRRVDLETIKKESMPSTDLKKHIEAIVDQLKGFHNLDVFKQDNIVMDTSNVGTLEYYRINSQTLLEILNLENSRKSKDGNGDQNGNISEKHIFSGCYIGIEIELYHLLKLSLKDSKNPKKDMDEDNKDNTLSLNRKDKTEIRQKGKRSTSTKAQLINKEMVNSTLSILKKINDYMVHISNVFERHQLNQDLLIKYLEPGQLAKVMATILLLNFVSCAFYYFDGTLSPHLSNVDLRVFLVRTWKLTAYSLTLFKNDFDKGLKEKDQIKVDSSSETGAGDIIVQITDFLLGIHEKVGDKFLCSDDNGLFPRLCLYFIELSKLPRIEEKHQCYYCLFHYPISSKKVHSKVKFELDNASLIDCFNVLWRLIEEKISKEYKAKVEHTMILDDLKSKIDLPNYDQGALTSYNKRNINSFLDAPLDFFNDFDLNSNNDFLCTMGRPGNVCDSFPEIYSKLYFGLARIQFYQHRAKFKNSGIMSEDEWKETIELFKKHLLICPKSIECWYYLGLSYSSLTGVLISRDANFTKRNISNISSLQKKSIKCFLQATKLLNSYKECKLEAYFKLSNFFKDFGDVLYNTTSHPLNMMPFNLDIEECLKLIPSLDNQPGFKSINIRLPTKLDVFRRAREFYFISENYHKESWQNMLMLTKCYYKLDENPKLTLITVIRSIKYTQKGEGSTVIYEPYYLLLSLVYKYLKKKKLDGITLYKALKKGFSFLDSTILESGEISMINREVVIEHILKLIHHLKELDKKKWQHKFFYLEARILYFENNDTKRAIEEMKNLIRLSNAPNQLIGIWKPEFERHGKRFAYISNYIRFFFELIIKQPEGDEMFRLLKRITKYEHAIYEFEKTWLMGQNYFVMILRKKYPKEGANITAYSLDLEVFKERIKSIDQTLVSYNLQAQDSEAEGSTGMMLKHLEQSYELYKAFNDITPIEALEILIIDLYTRLIERYNFFEDLPNSFTKDIDSQELRPRVGRVEILDHINKLHKDLIAGSKATALQQASSYNRQYGGQLS